MDTTLKPAPPRRERLPRFWRGEHDPPGTIFRPQQTFEMYGYWPRVLTDDEIEELGLWCAAPQSASAEAAESETEVPIFSPILALIQVRVLFEGSCAGCGGYSEAELLPYIASVQTAFEQFKKSARESEQLGAWLCEMELD